MRNAHIPSYLGPQATITHSIAKLFESANSIQKWTPARGHTFATPSIPRASTLEPREATPLPDGGAARAGPPGAAAAAASKSSSKTETELDARLAEESFAIHMKYGGDYMDENPITGRPGDFHFASTGRNDKLAVPPPAHQPAAALKPPALAPLNIAKAAEAVPSPKEARKAKSPRPGALKAKDRRKSKGGPGTATGTPTPT